MLVSVRQLALAFRIANVIDEKHRFIFAHFVFRLHSGAKRDLRGLQASYAVWHDMTMRDCIICGFILIQHPIDCNLELVIRHAQINRVRPIVASSRPISLEVTKPTLSRLVATKQNIEAVSILLGVTLINLAMEN